ELAGLLNVLRRQQGVNRRSFVADPLDIPGGNPDMSGRIPMSDLNNNLADRPAFFVDQKVGDMADVTIERVYLISGDGARAAQVDVILDGIALAIDSGFAGNLHGPGETAEAAE